MSRIKDVEKGARIVRKTVAITRAAFDRAMEEIRRREAVSITRVPLGVLFNSYILSGGPALPPSEKESQSPAEPGHGERHAKGVKKKSPRRARAAVSRANGSAEAAHAG